MSTSTDVPPRRWAAAIDDLSSRGVATDGVEVVMARSVTWPNGAWGCPKPGMSYTQMVVEGYQLVLKAAGRTYDYRFGSGDTPRLCQP